tara:strand:- start:380 stop:1171 length:792 start_codon:yes stop_codon:yes gene_type:complete
MEVAEKLESRIKERIEWVNKIIDFVAPRYDEIIENLNSKGSQINIDMWGTCEGDFPSTKIPQITKGLRLDLDVNWLHLIRNLQDDVLMGMFWESISNHLDDDWTNSGFSSSIWRLIGDLEWELETFPRTYICHKLYEGTLDSYLQLSLEKILNSKIEGPIRYKTVDGKRMQIANIGGIYSVFKLSEILSKLNIFLPEKFSELCRIIDDLKITEKTFTLRYKTGFGKHKSINTTYTEIKDGIVTLVKQVVLRKIELNQVEKLLQ